MNFDHIFLLLKARFVAEQKCVSYKVTVGNWWLKILDANFGLIGCKCDLWGLILRFVAERNCRPHIYAAILFGHEPHNSLSPVWDIEGSSWGSWPNRIVGIIYMPQFCSATNLSLGMLTYGYGNISGANFGQFRWFWFDFCRCAVRNKLRPQAPATNKLRPQSVISNCHDSKCNDLKKKNKCSLPCSPLLQTADN